MELPWLLNQHSFLWETRVVMTTPTWGGGCEQLRISICNMTEVTATKWSLASFLDKSQDPKVAT